MTDDHKRYHDEVETRLKTCSSKIDSLKATALGAAPREKLKLYDLLEDLLIKEKSVRVELNSLRRAPADGWARHQSATERALNSLNEAVAALP